MRSFEELNDLEQRFAINHCQFLILEDLYNRVIEIFIPEIEFFKLKLAEARADSINTLAFCHHPFIKKEKMVVKHIASLAEAMALEAEYPSTFPDGSYRKVIQL